MLSAALSSWGNLDPPYWYFCNLEQRTSGSEEGGFTLRVRVLLEGAATKLDHPVVACAHLSLFVHFGTLGIGRHGMDKAMQVEAARLQHDW